MIMLAVELSGWRLDGEEELLAWLEREAEQEQYAGMVQWVLVDEETITQLNEQYLGHEGVTDVITFDLEALPEEPELEPETDSAEEDGEVYICLPRALEQAVHYGVSVEEEVARLALHGLLHLAGWEDRSDEDRENMAAREDEGLKRAKRPDGSMPWHVQAPS